MKLTELLKQISPLPWPAEAPKYPAGDVGNLDDLYERHAANALPALVSAAEFMLETAGDDNAGRLPEAIDRIQKALDAARDLKK